MNILIMTYQGNMAGSTNSISFLAKGLAAGGHKVYVGCRSTSLLYSLLQNTEVNLLPMRFKGRFNLKDIKALRDTVNKYGIQLINAQSSIDRYTSILVKKLYLPDVKVVHTRRQRPKSAGGRLQNLFYVRGTDKVVVISDELKKVFVKGGYPEAHLQVIYNGTPATQYAAVAGEKVEELRKRFSIGPADTVVGCVSRMKEQPQLVRALALLDPGIKVIFAGIQPGSLDETAKKANVKNEIIYAGLLSHQEVLNLYKLMNVNVLASTMDGFGLALVEAMALGVPVVATNAYGIKNVVKHEVNGLLFENGDVGGLAGQLKRVLSDTALRQRLVENGRKTALEDFSMEKTIATYEQFFEALIRS